MWKFKTMNDFEYRRNVVALLKVLLEEPRIVQHCVQYYTSFERMVVHFNRSIDDCIVAEFHPISILSEFYSNWFDLKPSSLDHYFWK